ncbi:aldehyde dehydrogenase family protein [Dictyobacter kobayashii]|uniref:Aldehyde dehydrogenase n=1 Tax=Dictyobacter kobayashii TaxID=2014872 RepID=A0A402ASM3_9CHLR|nr:aldehyde dehydrogenase family protein [Dictyobacter kobayashii]GCE22087.1 aldehyde dehydrogenase [Dictyobacter kobayashii]
MISTPEAITITERVNAFLATPKKLLIDGRWEEAVSGKTFPTYDPATEQILTTVSEGDKADIEKAAIAARRAFEHGAWPRLTPSERGRLLWKIADLIEQHAEELALLESLDNGKAVTNVRLIDIPVSVDIFRYMAGWTTKIEGTTIPLSPADAPSSHYFAYTLREPVGVVGQIIPWNYPLMMAAMRVAPALAAGCTVILKPAEQTPLTALRFGEILQEAGLPAGVVNIVPGYGETAGAALAEHPDVDKISFTGSTEVGRLILKASAINIKRISLELGGKSPNIIFKDARLEDAIRGAADAIFANHGQVCCAGSRLYIEQDIFDEVIAGVSAISKEIKLGPGIDPSATMGPLISDEQLHRVCGYLESGFQQGARAVTGGQRVNRAGYYVEPTILVDTTADMKVVQEEIFGPVVVAQPFKDASEIAPIANNTHYGLAAGIWTQDISKAHHLANRLRAGTVWINSYSIFDSALPFGGYKQSGYGREMAHSALDTYTEVKAVCIKL